MSSSPPPPTSSGAPPTPPPNGSYPPSPPPDGTNPPPPPPPTNTSTSGSSITSANYFFGFVVTFVVLLLLFVGCGIGSWRRFRLIGTAWDVPLQVMDGTPFGTRKRGRRRLVRPVFWETWTTSPKALTMSTSTTMSGPRKWEGMQPISAAFVWSRSKLAMWPRNAVVHTAAATTTTTAGRVNGSDESGRGLGATMRMHIFPRRPRREHPPRPPRLVERPPPDAIQVAVMIAMPSPPSASATSARQAGYVGHSGAGEYQIGVMRIPWPNRDCDGP